MIKKFKVWRRKRRIKKAFDILSQYFPLVACDSNVQGEVTTLVFSQSEETLKNSASDILAGRGEIVRESE